MMLESLNIDFNSKHVLSISHSGLLWFSDWPNVDTEGKCYVELMLIIICKGINDKILSGNISEVGTHCNNNRCKYRCSLRVRSWIEDLDIAKN